MATITKAQVDLLRCIKSHGARGWGDVSLFFSGSRKTPQYLESAVLARVASALEHRGLIVGDEYPALTPEGERLLCASGTPIA